VAKTSIDVEFSNSHQNFNTPEDFDINSSKFLSLREEELNVEIYDDDKEVELLINHLRLSKKVFRQAWKIGRMC
jgi:hypothetical protein